LPTRTWNQNMQL
jgi:hypothetical protein